MSKRKKVACIAFTGAAAAATLGANAGVALAAPAAGNFHVQAPQGTPFAGSFSATASRATLVDANQSPFPLVCESASASGSIASATGTPAKIGTISTANFNDCAFAGVTFQASLSQPASLLASATVAGVTTGKIADIHAVITGVGNSCHASVTGSVSASYNNSTHQLTVGGKSNPTLHIGNPTASCLVLANSDPAFFQATYTVNSPASLFISSS